MVAYDAVSVVIPAYNEEASIAGIIKRIQALSPDLEIVVCSDGSTDRTAAVAAAAGARVVEHRYNLGNGAAVKSGAKAATRPYLVFLDADGQHPPEEMPALLKELPDYDMVVAARTAQSTTSRVRDIGNYVLRKTAEMIGGHPIMDLTSGFRAVKRHLFFRFAPLYPLRYSYPSTIILAFLCTGYFIKFVPMPAITRRTEGKSSISPIRDGFRFLNIIFRLHMLFKPFRIFFPLSMLFFILGLGMGIYQLLYTGGLRSITVILFVSCLVFFVNGLLAEQVSQIRLALVQEHADRDYDGKEPCEPARQGNDGS